LSLPTSPLVLGAIWMVGALASFMMMAVAGRELSDTMHTLQIVWMRSIFGILVVLFFVSRKGWASVHTTHLKLQIGRNLVHYAAQSGWFLSVALLPLATVFAIEFTTPIWVAILAVLFLGERMDRGRLIAIVLGFAGILIIVPPGPEMFSVGSVAVMGAAIGFALTLTITKYLTRTDGPLTILFYMMSVQTVIGAIPGLWFWVTPVWADAVWILFVGFTGLSAHYCLARAFQLADASFVMPIDFLRLPMAAVVGFFLYQESIELAVFIGAAVIFAGNYFNLRRSGGGRH